MGLLGTDYCAPIRALFCIVLLIIAAADHDDSNIETSRKQGDNAWWLACTGEEGGDRNVLRSAGKRVRGSIPAHGHVAAAFRGMGVKGGGYGWSYLLYRGGKVLNPLSSAHEHNTPTELYYGNFTPPSYGEPKWPNNSR